MEKQSETQRGISPIWKELNATVSYLYSSRLDVVFSVSLLVTALAIYIAWRYTKRRSTETPEKCPQSKETNTSNECSESVQDKQSIEEDQKHVDDDIPDRDQDSKCIFGSDKQMKIPKGCPMAHMFDLSKMSQLLANENQEDSTQKNEDTGDDEEDDDIDPQQYMSHIQSQVKRSQQRVALKKIEEEMSAEQKEKEREIQRQQLEAIFKMMAEHQEKFGVSNMDEMQSQVKLYM